MLGGALAVSCAGEDAPGTADVGDRVEQVAEATGSEDDASDGTDGEDGVPEVEDGAAAPTASGAEATWLGETLAFDRITCQGQPGVGYVVRAVGDDGDLAVVFAAGDDPTNPVYDFAAVDRVELYRGVAGGSIGDGEGYLARPDLDATTVDGVTGSESGASGTLSLAPDEATTAPEVNPDGGELTFSIGC